jgi:exodeoxyribonuclease VII small subunit
MYMAKKQVDYQTLSAELDVVLNNLQRSDIQVDEAIRLYEQGLKLIEELEANLEQAENKLTVLKARQHPIEDKKG